MLPKIILVPIDLGNGADQTLDYACELATAFGAKIHLLNVVGVPMLGVPELGVAMPSATIDSIMQDSQVALDKLAETKHCTGEVLLRTGDAHDVINATAKALGADLIVMSTHGRRGISRALLGSVTELVVRTAPCPVLTVHVHPAHDEAAA